MPKSINLTGTSGKKYNLDELQNKNTRKDSSEELLVQVWYWNPNGIDAYKDDNEKFENHKKPNPPSPVIGQMWLSKLVDSTFVEEA